MRRHFDLITSHEVSAAPTAVSKDPFRASLLTNAAPTQSVQIPETNNHDPSPYDQPILDSGATDSNKSVLRTTYRATTNRMLRVAVNGFFESMGVVLQVMEELDIDVIHAKGLEGLEKVQGVEQGMTGTTITGS